MSEEKKDELPVADPATPAQPETPQTPPQEEVKQQEQQQADNVESPKVEEPAKEPEQKQEDWSGDYAEIDNEHGQAAVSLLKDAGITAQEASKFFEEALATGDLSKVNWNGLSTKLDPSKMLALKAHASEYNRHVYAPLLETKAMAEKEVGGAKNWATLREWAQAKEKSDPDFAVKLNGIRAGINQNGYLATVAVKELKSLYNADPKTNGLNNDGGLVTGDQAPVGVQPMTRREYYAEVSKLHKNTFEVDQAALQQLQARRAAGRKAGI